MQILLNGLIVGSAYALLGIGFSLLYSTVRSFNLAYGMVAVWGVFVTWQLSSVLHWPFAVALLVGVLVTVVLSVLSYLLLFRVMTKRHCSNVVILVASFGLLIILQNLAALIWGDTTLSLDLSDRILPGYEFFGLIITAKQIVIVVAAVVVMLFLEILLMRTKLGLAIRAIGDNQELTKVLGLETENIILGVFVLSGILSSLAASLYSLEIGVRPTYGVFFVIKAFIAAIIGGMGSARGALLGALMLGVAENLGIYAFGGAWQDTVAFVLLTVFLLFRPEGLVAKKRLLSIS